MAQIIVNEEFLVNGRLTVNRALDSNGELVIEGMLATHYYFEEITQLETPRYKVKNVDVKVETFGSDDFDIVYQFTASGIDIKDGISNLRIEEIVAIEDKIYNDNGLLITSNINLDTSRKEVDNE